jgi:hypothetical protein
MERRHHLAQRALVVTKLRRGAGWSTTGRGCADRAGAGRAGPGSGATRLGRRHRGWAGRSEVRLGRQCEEHLVAAHVEAVRERDAGERKGGVGYYTRLCLSGRHISRQT